MRVKTSAQVSIKDPITLCAVCVFILPLECPVGTYSEGVSNGSCEACPANSEATQTGLTECPCIQDYYRAPNEGASVACTRE